MWKVAIAAGLAALLVSACQKPTELASEANAKYDKGVAPALPPASVTLDSVPEVAPPPEDTPADVSTAPASTVDPAAGYSAKTTPDTVADYRATVSGDIGALPAVGDAAGLARAFVDWRARAAASPGAFEAGAVQLGADEQQYKPSDAELVAAEAGDRLSAALNGADEATRAAVAEVLAGSRSYKRFDYRHSDVMGSGRYFYASPPKDASVPG